MVEAITCFCWSGRLWVRWWWSRWDWKHWGLFQHHCRHPRFCSCVWLFSSWRTFLPLISTSPKLYETTHRRFLHSLSPSPLAICRARCIFSPVRQWSSSFSAFPRVSSLLRIWRCGRWASSQPMYFQNDFVNHWVDLGLQDLEGSDLLLRLRTHVGVRDALRWHCRFHWVIYLK